MNFLFHTIQMDSNRFDHHQRGFEETLNEQSPTKLSSAGLIYKHFGRQVLRNVLEEEDETVLSLIYDKVYSVSN